MKEIKDMKNSSNIKVELDNIEKMCEIIKKGQKCYYSQLNKQSINSLI